MEKYYYISFKYKQPEVVRADSDQEARMLARFLTDFGDKVIDILDMSKKNVFGSYRQVKKLRS